MPILKPTPYVEFDPTNPEHVAAILEIEKTGRRGGMRFNFNYPPPFQGGVEYAQYKMFVAYGEMMAQHYPEVFPFERNSTTTAADASAAHTGVVRQLPVLGRRAKPLQETISRSLPPGSTLG